MLYLLAGCAEIVMDVTPFVSLDSFCWVFDSWRWILNGEKGNIIIGKMGKQFGSSYNERKLFHKLRAYTIVFVFLHIYIYIS